MYETILRLYKSRKIAEAGVNEAVRRGWITPQQAEVILKTEVNVP